MKRLNASVMTVAVVLALIAFVAPSSAVSIGDHEITFVNHTFDGTYSTWTYEVTSGSSPSLSHWDLTWCNPGAMYDVSEIPWEYVSDDLNTGITGMKFENGHTDWETRIVWFKLIGDFREGAVWVGTKANGDIAHGYVNGPINCNTPIPEFSTIAIPIASILGLLFFFNHRKRREEE